MEVVQRNGIECEHCGGGTLVVQTVNLGDRLRRLRICRNPHCRKTFYTLERRMTDEPVRRDRRPERGNPRPHFG